MRRYRDQIIFALMILGCFVVVGMWGQDPPKGSPAAIATLKPGDEVKPLELEAANLGKLRAQLGQVELQEQLLQQQYNQLLAEAGRIQAKIDLLVKDVQTRIKKEKGMDVVYDQRAGEDGTFKIPPATPKMPEPTAKK